MAKHISIITFAVVAVLLVVTSAQPPPAAVDEAAIVRMILDLCKRASNAARQRITKSSMVEEIEEDPQRMGAAIERVRIEAIPLHCPYTFQELMGPANRDSMLDIQIRLGRAYHACVLMNLEVNMRCDQTESRTKRPY
ncbi:hypothetical protein SeLEV6574_g00867 [Synchytrium endobioticum]|nr:hypothetical protein SeLEV6574_g00867 [Synchytrium endobioticum]